MLPHYSPDSIAGNDHEVMVIIYCQHFDVRQGGDHLLFWRQILVPLVEVITCRREEDRLLLWQGDAAYPQTVRNTALPKGNASRIRASAPTTGADQAVGTSDREICHVSKASALASPTRCYQTMRKRCLCQFSLFSPQAQCHFCQSWGHTRPTAHGI